MDEAKARALFTAPFTSKRNTAGLNDDAAVVAVKGRTVLTVDTFRDGTHWPEGARAEDAAYLAVAGTLSDLAGMGATPIGVLVALGYPPRTTPFKLGKLAEGVRACLADHGGELLGGDTKPAPVLELVTTGVGGLAPGKGLFRHKAKAGDAVCVTGPLGGAGAALERLKVGDIKAAKATPLLRPQPRTRVGAALAQLNVKAGMDLSDGLAPAARDLAARSGVRIEVAEAMVPLHDWTAKLGKGRAHGLELAFGAGGDYELLVTVPRRLVDKAASAARRAGATLHVIGRVTQGTGAVRVGPSGSASPLKGGFVHGATRRG